MCFPSNCKIWPAAVFRYEKKTPFKRNAVAFAWASERLNRLSRDFFFSLRLHFRCFSSTIDESFFFLVFLFVVPLPLVKDHKNFHEYCRPLLSASKEWTRKVAFKPLLSLLLCSQWFCRCGFSIVSVAFLSCNFVAEDLRDKQTAGIVWFEKHHQQQSTLKIRLTLDTCGQLTSTWFHSEWMFYKA